MALGGRAYSEEVCRVRTFDEAFPDEDLERCNSQQVLPHENSMTYSQDEIGISTQPLFQSPAAERTPGGGDDGEVMTQPLMSITDPLCTRSQPVVEGGATQPTPQINLSERFDETAPQASAEAGVAGGHGLSEAQLDADLDKKCIYIDRISPVLSDADIIRALDAELAPPGVAKVRSLEVIRTQRSRHVHAFCILTSVFEERGPEAIKVPVTGQEYINVQLSTTRLNVPLPPTPSNTVHIRFYALRKESAWAAAAHKMTWEGLLASLEVVEQGCTRDIVMVADDQSPKSNTSHSSVLLCIFFCQCTSVEAAARLRAAVHDKAIGKGWLENTPTLLRVDYAKGEKKLHDTTDKLAAMKEKFADAAAFGRRVGGLDSALWGTCRTEGCRLCEAMPSHSVSLCKAFTFKGPRQEGKRKKKEGEATASGRSPSKSPSKGPTGDVEQARKRDADEVSLAGTDMGLGHAQPATSSQRMRKRENNKRMRVNDPIPTPPMGLSQQSSAPPGTPPPLIEYDGSGNGGQHAQYLHAASQPGMGMCYDGGVLMRDPSQMDFTAVAMGYDEAAPAAAPGAYRHSPYAGEAEAMGHQGMFGYPTHPHPHPHPDMMHMNQMPGGVPENINMHHPPMQHGPHAEYRQAWGS